MTEPHIASTKEAESKSNRPSTIRLVIRAEIIPQAPPPIIPPPSHRRTLALVVGIVAALALLWIGISLIGTEPISTLTEDDVARSTALQKPASPPIESAPVVTTEPTSTSTAETTSGVASSVETDEKIASPVVEVIPDVPRSALRTIRGTIRVSVRVTVDTQGFVIAATSVDRGPSRYFERLATEASRKWTFATAQPGVQRQMLVRFNFTRERVSAHAERVK